MAWTVGELKAELDNYGDHLLVEIVVETEETSTSYQEYVIDDYTLGDLGPVVTLNVEL